MIAIYKKNILKNFIKCFLKVSFVFLIVILIMNLLEELTFFKETEKNIILPIFLTLINAPSILMEVFPFIFLISCIFFFIDIIERNELPIYKIYGLTNLKIIQIIAIISFFLGILIIIFFYNISSNLKFLYFDIKNKYSKDDKYLAVVTSNGLWIRDEINSNINYINADKLHNESLFNVTISQFNKEFDLIRIITAKEVVIKDKNWILKNVNISKENNNVKKEYYEIESNFDLERILSIFENLSSLSLLELEELKNDYIALGYNTDVLDGYKHKLYSFPFYLTIMSCLAAVLMLNIKYNKSKIFHISIGILISVIIYYINQFFNVIIETKDVPYIISIWGPHLILIMILIINLIRINEK